MTKKEFLRGGGIALLMAGFFFGNNCQKIGSPFNSAPGALGVTPSGSPTSLNLFAALTTIPVKACNGPITLALLNSQGAASVANSPVTVQLSSSDLSNTQFFIDSTCTQLASNQLVIPAGTSQAGFYLSASVIESLQISAQSSGLLSANLNLNMTGGMNTTPIQHVVVIMQENRSFDHYFGTYPGVDGLPTNGQGQFTTCLPQPQPSPSPCIQPFHDTTNYNDGSGHTNPDALTDVDNYQMDGFVIDQDQDVKNSKKDCKDKTNPKCVVGSGGHDVMGYHNRNEIPNYWSYADNFVLLEHLFEPALSWSLVSHLYLVSNWSASCSTLDPMSCLTYLGAGDSVTGGMLSSSPPHVSLTWNAVTGAVSYNVKRSTISGKETTLQNVTNATSYLDYRVSDGVNYYYVVSSVDSNGVESANSPEVGANPQGVPYANSTLYPDPISIAPTSGSITITFGPVKGVSSYNVKRGLTPGSEVTIGQVPKNGNNNLVYTDTTVTNGTTYYYIVTAGADTQTAPASLEVSAVAGVVSGNTPTGITANSTLNQSANAWTDMSYLLDMNGVSWKYYIGNGNEPDCEDGGMTCPPTPQNPKVPSYWNPFGYFTTVASKVYGDGNYLADHVITNDQFFLDIQNGTLPAVSWLIPADIVSEHPAAGVQEGMEYVTSLVNAIMRTGQPGYKGVNYWSNTVIIITWDDWGGFYDHVPPPIADYLPNNGGVIGYGIRVPGLLISPYVKHGIDSQTLSFDHFNKLIEDLFMGHQRLDPALDGRADSRPTVREGIQTVTNPITQAPIQLGDLMNDFDFNQAPIPPLILTTEIPIGFVSTTSQKTGAPISSQWALVTLQNGTQATYNLYRTQTSGSGYQLVMGCSNAQAGGGGNLSTCNSTSGFSPVICCTDPNVTSGQEYYYVVTSVLNGVESLKSAELAVIAP